MKIKNLLIITIITFVIVLLIINLSIFFTNQRLAVLAHEQDISVEIETHTGHLDQICNNYFLYQNEIELFNWQSNITTIYDKISELSSSGVQQSIISILQEDTKAADNNFNNTVYYLRSTPRNQSIRVIPEFQSTWNQSITSIQKLDSDQSQFLSSLRNENDQAQMLNIILIIVSLIVFGLYLFTNYFITYRKTLRSISELQKGIEVIGSGNLTYSVRTGKKDEIGRLTESVNDMTIHLKALTDKLQNQERMAAIGQTAGMVGHDLRNPLQSVIGELYLAKIELNELPASEQKTDLLDSIYAIEQQTAYMDKIVSDLQTFVRPVEVYKEVFNVKQFIKDRLTESQIPSTIKTNLQVEEALELNADQQLTKRALLNLIANSIQAMPNGGQLTIRAEDRNTGIMISLEDTGAGIPNDIKPQIFTPLFTTKSRGQGFGLAVCKRVIEAQGGTITFESEVDHGTKFIIELPKTQKTTK